MSIGGLNLTNPFNAPQAPTSGPIVPNLPAVQQAFANKYTEIAPSLDRFDPSIRNSLINFDLKRVARGQAPLSKQATALALMSAQSGQAATAPREPSATDFFNNVTRNVREITTAIPRIIPGLIKEVGLIGTAPEAISEAFQGDNIGEVISGIANAPGIRLLPGAYTVGNIASGQADELAKNPVMTALDLLPGIQKAATRAPVYKLLQEQNAAIRAGGQFAPEIRPLRALATRKAVDGAVVPNVLGNIGQAALRTRPLQVVADAFGQQARAASRVSGAQEIEYHNLINPNGLPNTDPTVFATREARGLNAKYNISPARAGEISDTIQMDPARISTLSDTERAYVAEYRELQDRISADLAVQAEIVNIGGEVYDAATGRRLQNLQTRVSAKWTRINTMVIPRLDQLIQNGADARVIQLRDQLLDGNLADANRTLTGLTRGKTRLDRPQAITPAPGTKAADYAPADILHASIANMRSDIRGALAAETLANRALRHAVPARFQPLIGKRAAETYVQRQAAKGVVQLASPDTAAAMAQAVLERRLVDVPGFSAKEFRNTVDEIRGTWQAMRDVEGLDPVFVHRVAPGRFEAAQHSGVLETIPSLSQAKTRVADISPSVRDISVSLSHQGMEVLAKRVSESYIRQMVDTFAKQEADLARQYTPAAQAAFTADPRIDFSSHLKRLIEADFTRYDPRAVINWSTNRFDDLNMESLYLPKTVANNIQRSHNPSTYRLSSVIDPITGAFRTALLPLSPRWHIYNILGGGIMLGARTGPAAFLKMGQARKLMNAVREGDVATIQAALPRELTVSLGGAVREMEELTYRANLAKTGLKQSAREAFGGHLPELNFRAGATLGRIFNKVTTKSFAANQFVDDMYRTMAYLYGHDKAITKGLSKQAAERTGIELARKILQQWDEYTPIERQILRHVFPFYGFTQHLLRYTFKYPFDHPVRAEVMSAIARNELDDMGTGLPESFLNSFFMGTPDDQGNVTALSLQGLNPFEDVANMMTLAGWAGATNPALATVFEQMGIEGGTLELFPELDYDPSTGKLVASKQNPLMGLINNTVPQTQILTALLQSSSEYKEMMRTNPDGAWRMLKSQAGLPILFRNYDLPAEYFKAEIARQDAQTDAKNRALKEGADASRFPGLTALLQQVKDLQSGGQLAAYTPTYRPPTPEGDRGLAALLGPLPIG